MLRNLICLLALLLPATAAQAEPVTLRVMTFNVWYGGEQVDIETVAEEIRAARADIVGLQEVDGNLARIAALAGYAHIDERRRILSRFPIFETGTGRREAGGAAPYSITGLDPAHVHAWVMVRPGKVVAVANTHLSSDPSGMDAAKAGRDAQVVRAIEALRAQEAEALSALGPLASRGVPVFLTGDFNAPSHLDWTQAAARAGRVPYPLDWPASRLIARLGLRDSYREVHPDPVGKPGFTWTPGTPHPIVAPNEALGRIDFVYAGGGAETLASEIVGEPGGPDVDIPIAPYPSDHRALVSTFRVNPVDAPAMLSVSPRRVIAGESFLVRAYALEGRWTAHVAARGSDAAITGLRDTVSAHRNAVRLSTFGLAPGDYDVVLAGKNAAIDARAAFSIVAADAPAVIEAVDPAPGTVLKLRWRNAPGAARDWIGIYAAGYAAGASDLSDYRRFVYTEAAVNGAAEIDIGDLPPGAYEARLMLDEGYAVLASTRFSIAGRDH